VPDDAARNRMHIVLGGELKQLDGPLEFRDPSKVEFVGAYPTYDDAVRAWRAKAQQTVDNALARYFIIDAQKLLEPARHD
jgi:myo-inositol-1(or 4)-monophosphatase